MVNINREKIAILDGNSLLYRAFFALPDMSTKEGLHTNAVYGFLTMLLKLHEEIQPDYIIATFDKSKKTFRHNDFEDYKAGRKKTPSELTMQFPLIREILTKMGIGVFEMEGYEADDLIGTFANRAENNGMDVFIITGDRDALQLATDHVNVVINKKGISEKEIYNKDRFITDFGVTPTQYIDVKGLMGDKSDNIPGIPGVGEKTAFKLIKEYGNMENLLLNIDSVSGKKLKESLVEYREQAILSKKLATIITEVPIEATIDEMKTQVSFNNPEVKELCLRLQFKSILNKLQSFDDKLENDLERNILSSEEEVSYQLIDTIEELKEVIKSLKEEIYIKFYVENTNSFSNMKLTEIGILNQEQVYILNCDKLIEENFEEFIQCIRDICENSSLVKVTHGIKYGYTALLKIGINLDLIDFDEEIAAYLLDSSKTEYSIKTIYEEKLGKTFNGEGDMHKAKELFSMKEIYPILKKEIEAEDMNELLLEVEQPLTKVIAYMEYEGFNIDKSELDSLSVKFSTEIAELTAEIFLLAGEEFNINSPKQLGKILFEKLDLPVIKKTKTGYSTNAEVLDALKEKHPIIEKILSFRQLSKLYSTYIEGLKSVIDKDGRIHSNFTQTVTTTGRLSSTEPNLQNIPIKTENGRSIRKVFIPHNEESIILAADYSQIELRVLAHIAEDENMINAFNGHVDIHTSTAAEVFNVSIEEVTRTMRSNAKAVNFGIVYGIGDFSLAQDLGITRAEAKQYIDAYLARYSKVGEYMEKVVEDAENKSYVTTLLNRKRYIPEVKSSNKMIKALGKRLAMNAPIQGSAADIIKIAMVKVAKKLEDMKFKSKLILQVHDELILNVLKDEIEDVKALVKNEMEHVLELKVPLEVDISLGDTWYEAK